MNTQRGFAFLPFLGAYWKLLAVGLLVAAVGGYVWRCESGKTEAAKFLGGVEALGKQAEQDAAATIKENLTQLEKANAENKTVRTALAARTKQLRDERARSSYMPAPALGAKRPDLAAFDRTELDGAIRRFDAGVQGLIDEGDTARVDLDTAKKWAIETH